MPIDNIYVPRTTRPELTYYVTSESDSYGPECTTEQAQAIANYIVEKMTAYAEKRGYEAEILIVSHRSGDTGECWDDAGEAALSDMTLEEQANWTDWVGEALNVDAAV